MKGAQVVLSDETKERWIGADAKVQDGRVALVMPEEMKAAVTAQAVAEGMSVSRWARRALVAGLEAAHADPLAGVV